VPAGAGLKLNTNASPDPRPDQRIATLDLVRGVAVLGILAVNIAGFAGTIDMTDTPMLSTGAHPPSLADLVVFAGVFALVEGKMRALFSMLFGASMLLFLGRAEAGGRAALMQLRRLGWLACFGYLHYLLLWWGDILFLYACCGCLALALSRLPAWGLAGIGLGLFTLWHVCCMITSLPDLVLVEHLRAGTASAEQVSAAAAQLADIHARITHAMAQAQMSFAAAARDKWLTAPGWPLLVTLFTMGETLPLMLIGMALYKSGFWQGRWSAKLMWRAMLAAGALGAAWVLGLTIWAWSRHFPALAMSEVMAYWAGPEHLALGFAYAAALVLAAPHVLRTRLGRRLEAAGRMAFSNYLGTSLLMTGLFYGWGLGLIGRVGPAAQMGFVALGWAVMLAWSKPWLARYRQGPLEWVWRSLTAGRLCPMRQLPQTP